MAETESPSRSVSRSKSSSHLKKSYSSRKLKEEPERGVSRSKSSSATSRPSEETVPERSISRSKSSRARSTEDGAPSERGISRSRSKRSESRMKERSSRSSGSKRGDLKRSTSSSRRGGLERTSSERSTSKRSELRRTPSSREKSSRHIKRTSSRGGSFDEEDEMPSLMRSSSGRISLERSTSKRGGLKRSTSSRRGELRRTSSERSKSKRGELKRSSSSRGKSSRHLKRTESWRSTDSSEPPSLKRGNSSRSQMTRSSSVSSKDSSIRGRRGRKRDNKLRVNFGATDVCIYHEPKSRKNKKKEEGDDQDENVSNIPPSDLWYDRYEMIQFNKTYFADARSLVTGLSAEDKQVVLDITAHCKSEDAMIYGQDEGDSSCVPSDPLDMKLREALYQVFKKEKNHIGLSNLVAKEVYEDIKARRMKLVEVIQEIQTKTFDNPYEKANEIRKTCENVTKSSMVFARYVAWASTKMKAVGSAKTAKTES